VRAGLIESLLEGVIHPKGGSVIKSLNINLKHKKKYVSITPF